MKKILIRTGILLTVFVAAVIGFSYFTNRENTDMTADIQNAVLPYISFKTGDLTVNSLVGYVDEMDIPSMRDSITPVSNYKVRMNIHDAGAVIDAFTYEVYSLNGEEVLFSKKIKEPKEEITLQFEEGNLLSEEKVLKVTLHLADGQDVYYYTRVVDSADMNVGTSLTYVQSFFEAERDKNEFADFKEKLEPDSTADNSTFQTVTIQSDSENVSWGDLNPTIAGEAYWTIKEVNDTYAAVELNYKVTCAGEENETGTYNVKEFFRVRYNGAKMYLFDYYRTMNQIFDGSADILSEKGVLLGITSHDVEYMTNKDGSIVSFVQERELWSYNKDEDEISLVFSFSGQETNDIRYHYDQHDISLITVDKNGSTTFSVSGYMNRGAHEGENGVVIYYFDIEKNAVEEKAFIPSDKSYSIINNDDERMVYYNNSSQLLHILLNGTLYEIDLEKDTREVMVDGLTSGQYVGSNDGHIFAYQVDGSAEDAEEVQVLDLATGKGYAVEASAGECVMPLGFVNEDFVYGVAKKDDVGTTISGEKVVPMYKVVITDSSNNIQRSYEKDGVYMLDVFVEDGLITLNRASCKGDVYSTIDPDYISSNEVKEKSNVYLESYTTELKKTQMRITFEDGIDNQSVKLLQPKQVISKGSTSLKLEEVETKGKYYVYSHGKLQNAYSKASYAVQRAEELSGVAVNSNQEYLWEKTGRDHTYRNEDIKVFSASKGESTLAACLRNIIKYEGGSIDVVAEMEDGKSPMDILDEYSGGEAIDLSGCTVDQVLYTVKQGHPVIAVTGDIEAILLIGYDSKNVTYIDPSAKKKTTVTTSRMEEIVESSGNTFIGYVKSGD